MKKACILLLIFGIVFSTMPVLTFAAENDQVSNIKYIDAEGREQICLSATKVVDDNKWSTWYDGWYVVDGNVKITATVTCQGNVKLILKDGCYLTITDPVYAGIRVTEGNSLTIYAQSDYAQSDNTGTMNVTGGPKSAGIGGNVNEEGYNITINGGVIFAQSSTDGYGAAGIGGGAGKAGHDITINNAGVNVSGSNAGAGIGGGYNGWGYHISISNSNVVAYTIASSSGKDAAACIGGGANGQGEYITISNSYVYTKGDNRAANIGGGSNGEGKYISITNNSRVYAADRLKPESVTNVYGGAGIGGGVNRGGYDIIITDSYVSAKGARRGAGIGGGEGGDADNISITNSDVYAYGNYGGAGIGGGSGGHVYRNGNTIGIIIDNSFVRAYGDIDGAGIGGGEDGQAYNICIRNGSDVVACGGDGIVGGGGATGIGGGQDGTGDNISIYDSKVTASGGLLAAGIGGGENRNGTKIYIINSEVAASGGTGGAGIGGGSGGSGDYISIYDSKVNASGGDGGAGIGGGAGHNGTSIYISNSEVTADGNTGGAGIGGGVFGKADNITITGDKSYVKAIGGNRAAGIGGGTKGWAYGIYLYGGNIKAYGGNDGGAGIGGGYYENARNIRIMNCNVYAEGRVDDADAIGSADNGGHSSEIYILDEGPNLKLYLNSSSSATSYSRNVDLENTFYSKRYARIVIDKPNPQKSDFAASNYIYTYDGSAKYATVTAAGTVTGLGEISVKYYTRDKDSKEVEVKNPTDAGEYTIKVTTTAGTHYNATQAPIELDQKLVINKKTISVKWQAPADLIYSGTAKVPSFEVQGFIPGDDCSVTASITDSSMNNVNAGQTFTFTAGLSGADKDNYTLQNAVSDSYTILKYTIKLKGVVSTFKYDGNSKGIDFVPTSPASAADVNKLTKDDFDVTYYEVNSDTISATPLGSEPVGVNDNNKVYVYVVTLKSDSEGTTKRSNYTFDSASTYVGGSITEVSNFEKKLYDNAGYMVITASDPLAQNPISFADPSVSKFFGDGSFINQLTNTNDGARTFFESSNETVATVDASGNVTIKGAGNATISATSKKIGYADTSASYELTVSKLPIIVKVQDLTGENAIKYGDEVPAYSLSYTVNKTGYDQHIIQTNRINGTPVFTGYKVGTVVGEHSISVSGLESDVYDITYETGTLKVQPKVLERQNFSVTAYNKTFDGNKLADGIIIISGALVGSDNLKVSYSEATFPDDAVEKRKTVTFTGISLVGDKSSNYSIAEGICLQGIADINAAVQTSFEIIGIPGKVDYGDKLTLGTKGAQGTVSYSVESGHASINGNVLTVTGAGEITVKAVSTLYGYEDMEATKTFSVSYKIIKGDNQTIEQGYEQNVEIRSNAPFAYFKGVSINGDILDKDCYDATEGSTVITLKHEYLSQLSVGEYSVSIISDDGSATARLTVSPAPSPSPSPTPSPDTGDRNNFMVYLALFALALSAIITLLVVRIESREKR